MNQHLRTWWKKCKCIQNLFSVVIVSKITILVDTYKGRKLQSYHVQQRKLKNQLKTKADEGRRRPWRVFQQLVQHTESTGDDWREEMIRHMDLRASRSTSLLRSTTSHGLTTYVDQMILPFDKQTCLCVKQIAHALYGKVKTAKERTIRPIFRYGHISISSHCEDCARNGHTMNDTCRAFRRRPQRGEKIDETTGRNNKDVRGNVVFFQKTSF